MLVAIVLIVLALIPAVEALYPAVQGTSVHESETVLEHHLTAKLEEVLARQFSELDTEAQAIGDRTISSPSYSDASGTKDRRLVFLSRYDADDADTDSNPFTGTDEGLLWLRVAVEGTRHDVETLTSFYE